MSNDPQQRARVFQLFARREAARAALLAPGLARACADQAKSERLAERLTDLAKTTNLGAGPMLGADLRSTAQFVAGLTTEAERHRSIAIDQAKTAAHLRRNIAGHSLRQQFADRSAQNAMAEAEAEAEARRAAALPPQIRRL